MNKNFDDSERSTDRIDISNLKQCIEEVRNRWALRLEGPTPPKDYNNLLTRLENSKNKLPKIYVDAVYKPFLEYLQDIGEQEFESILNQDKNLEELGGVITDIAQAILQRGEKYCEEATNAFQAVVSDLYDGFLSDEDRLAVKNPDKEIIAPLIKWGNPGAGPYTWPADATENVGVKTAIVNLPPSHAEGCLLGWSSLGHETGGHDILHADNGLLQEIRDNVKYALKSEGMDILAKYLGDRIDETASDILGILNMGPAVGIGVIGYFCGIEAAISGKPALSNIDPGDGAHPVDILRGYLAAESVRLLKFSEANKYAEIIKNETNKYLNTITLDNHKSIDKESVCKACKIVADIVMNKNLKSLENHSLGEIQNWHDSDEDIVNKVRLYLRNESPLPQTMDLDVYATHVVAAAVYEAVSKNSNISLNFERMIDILQIIQKERKIWGISSLEAKEENSNIQHNKLKRIIMAKTSKNR